MLTTLLAGLTPRQFMARHWQKEALLVRNAIAGFKGFLDRADVSALAADPDVESRLIVRDARRWHVTHGPFSKAALKKLPARNWTLLIQGVNLHSHAGAQLLAQFNFIPHARLDDLMVSYAAPGGGVGPHFDSYDVFLLQGFGQRRWQVSQQRDLTLKPRVPLKILRHFVPTEQWDLNAGDMLYLPPRYAHNGVALEPCTTYSVGFRAPDWREFGARFLEDFAERLTLEGRYTDPRQPSTSNPGLLPTRLVQETCDAIDKVRWKNRDVALFLGRYLSEPKHSVFFEPPDRNLTLSQFGLGVARQGARLALKSQMLYTATAVFLNGESIRFPQGVPSILRMLADHRALPPSKLSGRLLRLLKDWHDSGFLILATS